MHQSSAGGLNEDHRVDQQARAVAAPLFVSKAAAELHRDVNGHGGIAIFSLFSPLPYLFLRCGKDFLNAFHMLSYFSYIWPMIVYL